VQRPLTSGPRGWPAGPTLQPLVGLLHGHALQEVVTRNSKLEVDNSSLDPYKYPLPMEFMTPHSTCSSPLVKVLV
jgi:hypothetical protein